MNITRQAIRLANKEKDSFAISNAYQDLSTFYGLMEDKGSALNAAKQSFQYNNKKEASSILSLAWAYCDVDSVQKSRDLILHIPRHEYQQYGSSIYSLFHEISLKEHNYLNAKVYNDSLVSELESANNVNSAAKDNYYNRLIRKERLRTKEQNASQIKSGVILGIIIISLIAMAFILFISQYKRKQMQIQNEEQQERKRIIIDHQQTQLSTMRNFLMRKISILRKLESLKAGKAKQVLLSDADWEELEAFLNSSDDEFTERLKRDYPNLTKKDLRFLMLIRIDLPYSIIAQIYNIEPKSVKQKLFLIKEKLGLKNCQKSAKEFIKSY